LVAVSRFSSFESRGRLITLAPRIEVRLRELRRKAAVHQLLGGHQDEEGCTGGDAVRSNSLPFGSHSVSHRSPNSSTGFGEKTAAT